MRCHTIDHEGARGRAQRRRRAFTLVELLVVVGVIAVVVAILMPALVSMRERGRRVQCANNLRSIAAAVTAYAMQNDGQVPQHAGQSNWLWDVPIGTRNALVAAGGALPRETFYCPSVPRIIDGLWSFDPTYAVTAYFWLGKRPGIQNGATWTPTNLEQGYAFATPNEDRWVRTIRDKTQQGTPSTIVLLSDAIMSRVNNRSHANRNFVTTFGGYHEAHGTSHVNGDDRPEGANVMFLDGHAEWRPFDHAKPRFNGPAPYFWF